MADAPTRYDIAIIGSGISGSSLGAILARHGLRVIIFEAGVHPRFAVGESMILETSKTMRAMAELFDVPELAFFSSENYLAQIGTSHGLKRHFSFLHHEEGRPQDLRRSLQAVIPQRPHGYELHIHRQDSDYLLTSVAVRYGATVLQGTPVKDITLREDGVEVLTAQGALYQADYIVDAGGMRSLLAEKFGWRSRELQAHTRTIYTHSVYSVLWLLGAYTEYVKLLSTRARARSRAEYFAEVQTLRLVGGGFGEFKALADRIDAILEAVDPCDEAAVDRAVAEIRELYDATPWVPWAFRQVLAGKNHLSANKLRLSLLRQSSAGFMGEGAFRQHFFGDATMAEVARFFAGESVKYSASALTLRKRPGFRGRPTAPTRALVSRG